MRERRLGSGRCALVTVCAAVAMLAGVAPARAVLPGPNGKIVFTSGRDDGLTVFGDAHAQLWVAARAGATPVRVTANAAVQHRHASWSPDRTKLVYSAGVPPDYDIYILDLTQPISSTNPRNITQSPGIAEDRPSWSPDGTRVAYQSKVIGSPLPAEIVAERVTDPMFTTVLTQPSGTGDAGKPVWSPDSKTLYYSLVVNPGGSPVDDDIYAKAADDSGSATPIVTGSTDDYQPALSPDGQNLCFTRGAFGTTMATVQRSTITGANIMQIANSGQGDYNCAWSPDGTEIAYVQGVFGNGDLMVTSSDGTGTPTALVPNVAGRFDGNPDWTRNPSPTCQSKTVRTEPNATVAIPLHCVDPAPENDPVTLSIVTSPAHGTLSSISSGSISYTPARGFSGVDQFTFVGNDGTSDSKLATIQIRIRDVPARISTLRVSPSRFRLGSKPVRITRGRARVGTTISFMLSKPARVKLVFAKALPGRKVKRRCVARTHAHHSGRRCTRFTTIGTLSFEAHAGRNTVAFEGRVSQTTKLTVGSYRLTVSATDASGTRSRPRTTNFTIVRR